MIAQQTGFRVAGVLIQLVICVIPEVRTHMKRFSSGRSGSSFYDPSLPLPTSQVESLGRLVTFKMQETRTVVLKLFWNVVPFHLREYS